MPRHTFDPTAVSSTLEVFPKGDYLISVGEPKAFQGTTKSGKNEGNANWGIRWGCKIERVLEGDPNAVSKPLIISLDVQPDDQRPGEFRQKIVRFRPVSA